MEGRLRAAQLQDVLPSLFGILEEEFSRGALSSGEYHLYKDHLLSREIHSVRKVNQGLLAARTRITAPKQEVAKLAQLPRDPNTNRSSFGHIVIYLVEQGAHYATDQEHQLHASLRRAVKVLQRSFGDRLASVSFELQAAVAKAFVPYIGVAEMLASEQKLFNCAHSTPPKMVLSKEGEWVYPEQHRQQQRLQVQARQRDMPQQEQLHKQPRWQHQHDVEQHHGRNIPADQVQKTHLMSFSVVYRALGKDEQGRTIGGGISDDRTILSLNVEQPCLSEQHAQSMIKGFAACLQ